MEDKNVKVKIFVVFQKSVKSAKNLPSKRVKIFRLYGPSSTVEHFQVTISTTVTMKYVILKFLFIRKLKFCDQIVIVCMTLQIEQ